MAIQVATNVPKTVLIKFHVDKTFRVDGNATTGTGPPTSILRINCNKLSEPMGSENGTWTAQAGTAGDAPDGFSDWLYDSSQADPSGRYQNYHVLGAKITANSMPSAAPASDHPLVQEEIIHSDATGGFINNSVLILHKQTTGRTDIVGTQNYMQIQQMPYTSVRNMRGGINTVSGVQGARIAGTYSAKRWEGVSDVKDVKSLKGNFGTPPTEGGTWQLAIASREPATLAKQHEPQLVRVKVEYTVLLSDPITNNNVPMKTD
jgi:hypothetical protein